MNELTTMGGGLTAQRTPETVAAEIRTLTGMMLSTAVEIGRRMVEVKQMLPHGDFLPWIKEHTGHSASSANNYMRLFEEYGANCQTFGNLGFSKALALLSVAKDEREAFVQEVDAENLSTRELKEAIAARQAAERQLEDMEKRFREEEETSNALVNENERLWEQVKELEERAKEVIVAEDPQKVEAAVAAALEEAKAAHEKELAALKKKADAAAAEKDKLAASLKAAEEKAAQAKKDAEGMVEAAKASASGEAAKWQLEAEDLRKRLQMADPITAEFKGVFEQATAMVGKLLGLLKAAPAETAPNLRKALAALGEQIGKGCEG